MIDTINNKIIGELDFIELECKLKSTGEPPRMMNDRVDALEKALNLPLPGKPDESWRRYNLDNLNLDNYTFTDANWDFSAISDNTLSISRLTDTDDLILQNFIEKYSEHKSKVAKSDIKRANEIQDNKFYSLSEALSNDGIFIHAKGVVNQPVKIKINHPGGNKIIAPQIYILLEENAELDIFIEYTGGETDSPLSIGMIKGITGDSARLGLINYQNFNNNLTYFHFCDIMTEENGKTEVDILSLGGKTGLISERYNLLEPGAEANAYGLMSLNDSQFMGAKFIAAHQSPHTSSEMIVKSALKDKSRAYFNGNIQIPEGSVKSNGFLENRSLILGKESRSETIPQLEIIADDVKCSHGASVSDLDPLELFYLQSRGLSRQESENLMIRSFYSDIVHKMDVLKRNENLFDFMKKELSLKIDFEI